MLQWYPLEDVKTGQVYVRAMWMTLTQDINLLGQVRGRLIIINHLPSILSQVEPTFMTMEEHFVTN